MHTIERPNETTDRSITDPEPKGHIGRLTALSMTAGAAAAVALALFVFAGSTEPIIAGAVLFAFAGSWALLAVLSGRRTNQPQRWARVPAAIMAALGTAVFITRPSAAVMSAAGWIWPIGFVALAMWMMVQARRSMRSWARWVVLFPIFAVMIAAGISGGYETIQEARQQSSFAMPGDLVDVGGHQMHIHCAGTGSPTVVLEDGLGETSVRMSAWIAPSVAATTKVCVYDRAGRGWSEPAPDQEQGLTVVRDLHTLLDRHGEHGPYVLAGHSSGGVYIRAFTAAYPDEVAGLTFLDAQPAAALDQLPGYGTFYAGYRKASGVAPSVARFGLMRPVYAMQGGNLPEPQRTQERAFGSSATGNRSFRDELLALPTAMSQARSLTSFGDKPLVVVTAELDASRRLVPPAERDGPPVHQQRAAARSRRFPFLADGRSGKRADRQPSDHRRRPIGPNPHAGHRALTTSPTPVRRLAPVRRQPTCSLMATPHASTRSTPVSHRTPVLLAAGSPAAAVAR